MSQVFLERSPDAGSPFFQSCKLIKRIFSVSVENTGEAKKPQVRPKPQVGYFQAAIFLSFKSTITHISYCQFPTVRPCRAANEENACPEQTPTVLLFYFDVLVLATLYYNQLRPRIVLLFMKH